ncbi:MAG: hypothetical protein LBS54_04320 [Dysgonamonadaceae bacterium]|jgi:hypothetical protein|nr:hypothetical protein [Dysgonamonadaceae bacterium]
MEDSIKIFLSGSGRSDGSGSGNGYGYGYDNGNGSGYGSGDGSGYGDGYGYGSGYGDGDGYGNGSGNSEFKARGYKTDYKSVLTKLNGWDVWYVDNIPCVFFSVKGDLAKVGIVQDDFTFKEAFIAKYNGYFAHGETARKALQDAENKYFSSASFEETAALFKAEVSPTKKYPVRYFFNWHGRLTGSCELGRMEFAKSHNLDLDRDEISLSEFFNLVRNAYGAEKIRSIEE